MKAETAGVAAQPRVGRTAELHPNVIRDLVVGMTIGIDLEGGF